VRRLPPWLIMAVPALILAITAVLRYLNGQASIDLVVFDQGLWAASRGGKPWASVIGETLLEDHFGPGIFVFAPLYRLLATPAWLLVGQALAAWAAVRMIARRLSPAVGELRAALMGGALLVSPPVAYALLFDFHSVVLAVPLALAAVFALEDGRPRRALVLGLLAALFRIEVGLAVVVAFAVWPGRRRGRLVSAALLTAYVAVALHLESALGHDSYWAIHYAHLGASPMQALANPLRLASALLGPASLAKALPWLATGAFLCLRRPRRMVPALLLALPVLLSNWPGTKGIDFQYGFAPTLLLALAWIPAVQKRPERVGPVVAACLLLAVLLGPVVPALASSHPLGSFAGRYWVSDSESSCIVAGIPGDASVSASQPFTLLAHRSDLYLWPYPFQGTPPRILPASHMAKGDPHLAAGVDYLVVLGSDARLVPTGFVDDGQSSHYLRFRRAATTAPSAPPPSCH
jgi:uncharacterized membrane protein